MTNFYCTFRGTIASGTLSEIFQHSLAIISSSNESTVATALESAFRTAFGTGAGGLSTMVSNQVSYQEVTVAQINKLNGIGDDVLQAAHHRPFSAPPLVGASGNCLPAQTSLAVSLTGGLKANGASYKGRFYLPPYITSAILPDGRVGSSSVANTATAISAMFSTLKAAAHTPCVWSRSAGVLSPVTTIRVGDRYDTMRSRRNKGTETYTTTAIA